jgi:hypothetical protein
MQGGGGIFIDYEGAPTTGVNNDRYGDLGLDTLGLKSGFTHNSEGTRDISFAVAFLTLGRLDRPVPADFGLSVITRLKNRRIGDVPGSVRVVIRAGNRFYASEVSKPLGTTKDTTFTFSPAELASTRWSPYDPHVIVAYEGETFTPLPSGARVDLAGVLVTRVVNAIGYTRADFDTLEMAELGVRSTGR